MPDFTNIPRVTSEVVDLGTRITPPQLGPKVLVIGATDSTLVPLEEPIFLERADDISLFNKAAGGPSELNKKIEEVMAGGARNVEVFVLSDGSGNRYDGDALTPQQRYTMFGRAYELLLNHDVNIVVGCGIAIDMTGLAAGQNFAYQMANYCYQSTKEYNACVGTIGVQPPSAAVGVSGTPSLALQQQWVDALKAYNSSGLLGVDFTIYDGTTDSPVDGVPDNYAFWATTDEAIPVGSPPASAGTVRKDSKGNPIDIGAYISVVQAWVQMRNESAQKLYPTLGYYNTSGDGVYAGLITTLQPEISTTNQRVPGAPLRELSPRQVNDLCGTRFVCFWTQPTGFVVASGMTGAYNLSQYYRSDFVRLTTVRITHDAISTVRIVASPYIGKPNNGVNRSSLEASIDEGLAKMQKRGALNGFRFSLVSTPTMQVLGQIIVDLTLIPAFEITEITVRVGLAVE